MYFLKETRPLLGPFCLKLFDSAWLRRASNEKFVITSILLFLWDSLPIREHQEKSLRAIRLCPTKGV